jgi:predicted dehydrogenase
MARELLHLSVDWATELPADCSAYDAIIVQGAAMQHIGTDQLLKYSSAGVTWLVLTWGEECRLPEEFGVQPDLPGAETELRILFENAVHPLAVRLPDAVYVAGRYQPLTIKAAEVETLLYADYHYSHKPVWTIKRHGNGNLACSTLQDFSSAMLRQLLHRLLRTWQKTAPQTDKHLGVGILGYAPSVGQPHGLAAGQVKGLELTAICDLNPQRLNQAKEDFQSINLYENGRDLAADESVDLVVVATPPNLHAEHCQQMMAAGKHVLCEKPLALWSRETSALLKAAEQHSVHLSCHQNRRWDPDYLAIRSCVEAGRIGELFYLETFVGGFHHPCGYWHSDQAVSGGTSYDWGAHYLDWIVSLLPGDVEAVQGSRHKRVWHDVTNADQERIQIRFTDGREAEFIHSDIAAVRKPKWYLLGTKGSILGQWRDITTYDIDPIYYFQRSEIPATEMMPEISLQQRLPSGDIEEIRPTIPERQPYAFHGNLTDHILWGEPLAAPLADSVKVVAILEAAARSMDNRSRWEAIGDE